MFEILRIGDGFEFGGRVSWEDWHLRKIYLELYLAIWALKLEIKIPGGK